MKELHSLIEILDNLPNNNMRKNYLESIRKDPNIGRHDLLRLACNVLQESNFIESHYKVSFVGYLKKKLKISYLNITLLTR